MAGAPIDITNGMGGDDGMSGALSGILSAGLGAASGNPLAIASGALGIGLSLFGGAKQTQAAQQAAAAKQQIAGLEMQQDAVRRKAMELSANRQQIEVLRNAQRARSLALNNATTQGAQFGSGLQGGFGKVAGAANWNISGIKQNLNFGEQMFDLNQMISQQKMNVAGSESSAATGAGLSKLGGALTSNFGAIKNISTTLFDKSGSNSPYTGSGGLQQYDTGWMG